MNTKYPEEKKLSKSPVNTDEIIPQASLRIPNFSDPVMNLEKATKYEWKRGKLLGTGSYGKVFMGINTKTGELMAVKQIELPSASVDKCNECVNRIRNELELLCISNSCQNIVSYLGCEIESPTPEMGRLLNIFLEFVPGGSISSLLNQVGSFDESLVSLYTRQILVGLAFLHERKIIHRDLKGGNVLVHSSGLCKLADFGASTIFGSLLHKGENMPLAGTIRWMAPELMAGRPHDFKVDIWSLGCTVLEMLSGKPPWAEFDNDLSLIFQVVSSTDACPVVAMAMSKEASDFLFQCFTRDPELRPTAKQLLQHPFVSEGFRPSQIYPASMNKSTTVRRPSILILPTASTIVAQSVTEESVDMSKALTPIQLPPSPIFYCKTDRSQTGTDRRDGSSTNKSKSTENFDRVVPIQSVSEAADDFSATFQHPMAPSPSMEHRDGRPVGIRVKSAPEGRTKSLDSPYPSNLSPFQSPLPSPTHSPAHSPALSPQPQPNWSLSNKLGSDRPSSPARTYVLPDCEVRDDPSNSIINTDSPFQLYDDIDRNHLGYTFPPRQNSRRSSIPDRSPSIFITDPVPPNTERPDSLPQRKFHQLIRWSSR